MTAEFGCLAEEVGVAPLDRQVLLDGYPMTDAGHGT